MSRCLGLGLFAIASLMDPVIRERGGHKQKRQRATASSDSLDAAAAEISPLGTGLLCRWSEGQLSAVDVQELAALAVQSGCTDPEVVWLASIGAHGKNVSHCSRALYSAYCRDMNLPERYDITVPLREKGSKEASLEVNISLLLPHDWFANLSVTNKFSEFMGIPCIESWWAGASLKNPKFFQHPCLDKPFKTKGVPFVLHGDGAKLHDRDSLLIVSMKFMLGKSGFKDSHLYLAALPKSVATDEAWEKIWQCLAWSLDCVSEGVHPDRDHQGNCWPKDSPRAQLAGAPLMPQERFGVFWGMTGDLDYFMKDLGLPYHSSNAFCWRCRANRSDLPWNDFRQDAGWRSTILRRHEVRNLQLSCPLFTAACMSALMLMFDVMHVCDQGISSHVIANVLWTMVFQDMTGDKNANFETLWQRLREIYSELKLAYAITKFELKQICDPDSPHAAYPCLRQVRAAETRHLLKVVSALANERSNGSQLHKHRALMCEALVKFYDIIHESGYYITDGATFKQAASQFQLNYQWLSQNAMQNGQHLWSVVPKHHFFEHLVDQALFENPKMFWVYTGEDFVGRLCRVAHFVLPGKATHDLTSFLVERYLIGFHLRHARLDHE